MMTKFKVGDKVRAIGESHGWGCVNRGDVGVVKKISQLSNECLVDFPMQSPWTASFDVLELVERPTKKQRIEALEQTVEKQAEQIDELQSTIAKLRKALS